MLELRVLLIDDDYDFLKTLRTYIDDFCKKTFDEFEIKEFLTMDQSMLDGELIFLDIDLNGFNSIEAAGQLKMYNKNATIIFVTSQESLVFHAFQIQPFYFVRKNHLEQDLSIAFTLLRHHYLDKPTYSFVENGRKKMIYLDDIVYLECNDHMTTIYTTHETYDFYKSLKEMMSQHEFKEYKKIIQIHKKHCANLLHIIDIKKDHIHFMNDQILKIGRKYKDDVYEKYHAFMKGYLQ